MPMHVKGLVFTLLLVFMAGSVFAAACGGDDDNGGEEPQGGAGTGGASSNLTLVAENTEFDKDELTAPANTEVSLEFDNQDQAVMHNFSLYRSSDAEENLFEGELVTGPETTTYSFETPAAGEYFFRCDVHPDSMNGTFTTG
jgi:plastocyanin